MTASALLRLALVSAFALTNVLAPQLRRCDCGAAGEALYGGATAGIASEAESDCCKPAACCETLSESAPAKDDGEDHNCDNRSCNGCSSPCCVKNLFTLEISANSAVPPLVSGAPSSEVQIRASRNDSDIFRPPRS